MRRTKPAAAVLWWRVTRQSAVPSDFSSSSNCLPCCFFWRTNLFDIFWMIGKISAREWGLDITFHLRDLVAPASRHFEDNWFVSFFVSSTWTLEEDAISFNHAVAIIRVVLTSWTKYQSGHWTNVRFTTTLGSNNLLPLSVMHMRCLIQFAVVSDYWMIVMQTNKSRCYFIRGRHHDGQPGVRGLGVTWSREEETWGKTCQKKETQAPMEAVSLCWLAIEYDHSRVA